MFHIRKSKLKTARAIFSREYGISFSYTIEASMCSYLSYKRENTPFTGALYEEIGRDVLKVLIDFEELIQEEKDLAKQRRIQRQKTLKLKLQKVRKRLSSL